MFESLSDRFEGIFTRLRGKGRLSEADVDEVLQIRRDALRGEHPEACEVFEQVALPEGLVEFLTLVAYERLP